MRRSRWKASNSRKTLRKPPGGSASSTRCGKSRSFVRPVISRLRRVISPNPPEKVASRSRDALGCRRQGGAVLCGLGSDAGGGKAESGRRLGPIRARNPIPQHHGHGTPVVSAPIGPDFHSGQRCPPRFK